MPTVLLITAMCDIFSLDLQGPTRHRLLMRSYLN